MRVMTSPPETIRPVAGSEPARDRVRSVLVAACLLVLLLGVLGYLVVLMQPLADPAGGCGGG